MTKNEFINLLISNNIPTDNIHFQNSAKDGYYTLKNYNQFEAFYRERGKDYDCVGFPSKSDALEYLLKKLLKA
ncbi:MAG: hypothetical protein J6A78_00520 [Clostridia bacterium]|nr:hypothetical protein [Clostridia bacterium]